MDGHRGRVGKNMKHHELVDLGVPWGKRPVQSQQLRVARLAAADNSANRPAKSECDCSCRFQPMEYP